MCPQFLRVIPYTGGRTNIASALKMARDELFVESKGDRQDAPNFLVLFTDGEANVQADRTIPEAIESRIAGIHTIVIGVGKDLNIIEMEGIASYPSSQNIKIIDSFTKLNTLTGIVEAEMCNCESWFPIFLAPLKCTINRPHPEIASHFTPCRHFHSST